MFNLHSRQLLYGLLDGTARCLDHIGVGLFAGWALLPQPAKAVAKQVADATKPAEYKRSVVSEASNGSVAKTAVCVADATRIGTNRKDGAR